MRRTFSIITLMFLMFLCGSALAEDAVLYPIKENGRFGYINRGGNVVIEPQFAQASAFDDYGTALVRHENGLYSLIDHRGSIIVTCPEITRNAISYNLYGWNEELCDTWEEPFFEGMGLYSPTTKTIIYFDGQILDEPCTDPASTRVLVADSNDTYGYLDRTTGEIVIPLQYKTVRYDWTQISDPGYDLFVAYDFAVFHEGYAIVGDEDKNYFLIDEMGKVINLPGEPVTNVHEGKLNIYTPDAGWQVCNVEGEILSAPYDEIRTYQNGYCGAINWHNWHAGPEFFILDAEGQERLHHASFIGHEKFCGFETWNGYFTVTEGSSGEYTEIYHVDKGRLCTVPNEPMAIDYERELMVVDNGLRPSLCKLDGTEILSLPCNSFSPYENDFFEEGLWRICADNQQGYRRYGYLREDGTWRIPPQFISAEPFRNGLALCTDEDGYSLYIDTAGNIIWKSNVPSDVSEQRQRLDRAGVWYRINEEGIFQWLIISLEDWDSRFSFSDDYSCWNVSTNLDSVFTTEQLTRSGLESSWNRYDDSVKLLDSIWRFQDGCDHYIRLYQDGTYEMTDGFDQPIFHSNGISFRYNCLTFTDFGKVENQQFVSSFAPSSPALESWYTLKDGQLHCFRKTFVLLEKSEGLSNRPSCYGWFVPSDFSEPNLLPYALCGEIELLDDGTWLYENEQPMDAFWTKNGSTLTLTTMEGRTLQLTMDDSQSLLRYEGMGCRIYLPGSVIRETQRDFDWDKASYTWQEGFTLPEEN